MKNRRKAFLPFSFVYRCIRREQDVKRAILVNTLFAFFGICVKIGYISVFFKDRSLYNIYVNTENLSIVFYVGYAELVSSFVSFNFVPCFAEQVLSGQFDRYYCSPFNMFQLVFQETFSSLIARWIYICPLFLFFVVCSFLSYLSFNYLSFLLSLFLSSILFCLMAIFFFSFTIRLKHYNAVKALISAFASLLSGSLVPLILWPKTLYKIVRFSPFAMLIDAPIEILLGVSPFSDLIIPQGMWIIFFLIMAKVSFKVNAKKYVSYGG